MKSIFVFWAGLGAVLLLNPVAADAGMDFLDFRTEDYKRSDLEEKKWRLSLGAEYLQYPTVLPAYDGVHEDIKSEEKYDIYGANLGLGREFSLGGSFSTELKAGVFFAAANDTTVGTAGTEPDVDLSRTRDSHQVYGAEALFSLNYLVENEVLNFQPFVEFGAGRGLANIEKEYVFEGIQSDDSDAENYFARVEETFDYAKTSIGVNFVGWEGVLSYIKLTQTALRVAQRDTTSEINSSESESEDDSPGSESFFSASLGFAYMF